MRELFLTLFLFVLALGAAACGDDDGATPLPTAQASPVGASTSPPRTPNFTVVQLGLADGFPAEFPVFETATVVRGTHDNESYTAEWRTDSPVEQVAAFYVEALDTVPWTTTELEAPEGGGTRIVFENSEEGYSGQLGIADLTVGARILVGLEFDD